VATILFLCAAALVLGLLTALIAARTLADPVESVRNALAQVAAGSADVEVVGGQ
jgi:HAMP domain-containing protein